MAILAQIKKTSSGEELSYFYNDDLGSRRAIISSSGALIEEIKYTAFGELQPGSNREVASFTGKQMDATGLYYFNARYYDPDSSRFITQDPARRGNGWYTYCNNNPINLVDPSGKREVEDTYLNNNSDNSNDGKFRDLDVPASEAANEVTDLGTNNGSHKKDCAIDAIRAAVYDITGKVVTHEDVVSKMQSIYEDLAAGTDYAGSFTTLDPISEGYVYTPEKGFNSEIPFAIEAYTKTIESYGLVVKSVEQFDYYAARNISIGDRAIYFEYRHAVYTSKVNDINYQRSLYTTDHVYAHVYEENFLKTREAVYNFNRQIHTRGSFETPFYAFKF